MPRIYSVVLKKYKTICLMLWLLIGATACSNKAKVETLQPLSQAYQTGENLRLLTDSIIDLSVIGQNQCLKLKIPELNIKSVPDTIFSSYTYIPLETTEKCMLGQIEKIILCQDCFCILDRQNANAFLFELDGRFRCKLGERGHGPGEHLDAWNIAYDENKEQIVLLDLSGRKLLHYDLNGKLQSMESMYYLYTGIEYLADYIVCNTGLSHNYYSSAIDLHGIIIANRNHLPMARGFGYSERRRNEFSYSPILKKNDGVIFYDDLLSDTIWSISDLAVKPFIAFDYGGRVRFSRNEKEHITDRLYSERNMKIPFVYDWYVSSKYIYLKVSAPFRDDKNHAMSIIYSRQNDHYKIFGYNIRQRCLGDYMIDIPARGFADSKSLILIAEPLQLIKCAGDKKKGIILSSEERKMIDGLSVDDNPVLIVGKLIDF